MSGYLSERTKRTALILKEPHARVHCSTVYKSRDMETTRASTDGRMDGENVVYKYTHRILLSYKKREILMSATTKMNLEGMRMSEKLHTEKDEHSKISLT